MQRILEPELMDTEEEAASYDAMDNSASNAAVVELLVELGARGRILDIGTGPGHIPFMVCEQIADCTLVGIDLAKTMLVYAERHRATSPHKDRIEFKLADAKSLAFEDNSFDTVYSNTILHHIPDPHSFLVEARRVLKPDGALLIRDLFRPESPERALELVAMHIANGTPEQKELFRASLHAAFTLDELRALANAAGLVDATISQDSDRHVSMRIAKA
ncbi:MAG: ubiquinone/menaquinone biosynthesis C-methylase UbiE [Planctomycetota bacterium]|jgi:ubiquinone/menaquinone biosynthesis C-methylase UbiE